MLTTIRGQRNNPCNGCPDRYPACSDHCRKPEYLEWKEEQTKIKAAKAAYRPPAWTSKEMDPANYRSGKKRK